MTGTAPARGTRRWGRTVANVVLVGLLPGCHAGPLEPARTHPAGVIVASPRLGERPYGVAISRAGTVLVTRLDAATVSRADLPDTSFAAGIAVRLVPTDVVFNRDGTRAFVTNQHSQQVGIVDLVAGRQVDSLTFPGDAFRVLVAADDRTVFVTTNTGDLYRVDVASRQVMARFRLPAPANGLALDAGGTKLYVSTLGGLVAEINTATNTVLRTFTVAGATQGLAVAAAGTELYVADEAGGRLIVWSLVQERALEALPLGGTPFDVRVTPDDRQIYVSVWTAGQVLVFDRVSRERVAVILTGGDPRRIAFDPGGGLAVVANQAGWVDFIR